MHKLSLPKEANLEYHNLLNESNEIMSEYGRIMGLVHSFKLPTIKIGKFELTKPSPTFFYRAKYELSKIGREGISLTNRFLDWNNRVINFCANPQYSVGTSTELDGHTSVILHTSFLLSRADRLNSNMTLLQSNYNLRWSEIDNAINFWIAITAWGLSFLGLAVSIIWQLSLVSR